MNIYPVTPNFVAVLLYRPSECIYSGWLRSLVAARYSCDGGPSYFRAVRAVQRTAPAPVACHLYTAVSLWPPYEDR